MRPLLRRALRLAIVVLVSCALAVVALAVYWRRDATDEFYRVRGEYGRAEVLASWRGGASRVRLVELRNDRREAVSQAYVRRQEADADPRIVLIYAGAKTGKRILELIPERPGLALVSMQYPYDSPQGVVAHLAWPAKVRRAAFRTVAGGMLAVSFLQRDEGLALDKLLVVGSSLGSIPAVIHGALDDRVPTVLLVHGGGHLPTLIRANVRPAWYVPPALLLSEVALEPFDPLRWADRIAPRKLVMISARHDLYFPAESAERLYERAGEPKELIWTETEHVRSRKPELVAELVRQIERYMDELELAIPEDTQGSGIPGEPSDAAISASHSDRP